MKYLHGSLATLVRSDVEGRFVSEQLAIASEGVELKEFEVGVFGLSAAAEDKNIAATNRRNQMRVDSWLWEFAYMIPCQSLPVKLVDLSAVD